MVPGAARAQAPPANDDFADATSLSAETPVLTGSTVAASGETGEPLHTDFGFSVHSVWFKYTATSTRRVSIGSCGSFPSAVLAGYTGGALSNLQALEFEYDYDYDCDSNGSPVVTFSVVAGEAYWLAIDGYYDAIGDYRIELDPPPSNDKRSRAAYISNGYERTGSTVGATKEPGEADHANDPGGHSVWFQVYAESTVPIVVQACGSDFDTVLAVYGNGYGGDQELASDEDTVGCGPAGKASRLRFTPPSAGFYHIALDGHGGASGDYRIGVISNDDRAGAQMLYGSGSSSSFADNTYASAEPGEPAHAGSAAAHSLWYRFDALQPGQQVAIDTCSDFGTLDTVLAVYADGPDGLTELDSNDDDTAACGLGGGGSSITFAAPEYPVYVAVDGKANATGAFVITSKIAPPNDDRDDAAPLPDYDSYEYAETALATKEPAEPDHTGNAGGHSVWYALTRTRTQVVTIDLCSDASFDTLLAVYTDGYGGLQEVISSDDASGCGTGSSVQFTAAAGVRYLIAVDGKDGATGWFELATRSAPANDDFAAATSLVGATGGNTALASAQPGEPGHAGSPAAHSLWYTITTTSTRTQAVSTCSYSSGPTRIAVYEGATLDTLTTVASGAPSDDCAGGRGARVSWRPPDSGAHTYRLAVDQAGDLPANFTLSTESAPANDDRAAAQYLYEGSEVYGSTSFATHEPVEPHHASAGGVSSVWYRWQPTRSARARLSTCGGFFGSSSDTIVAVYTDGYGGLQEVASDDDTPGCGDGSQSQVDFDAVANTIYYIAVDARAGEQGVFSLRGQLAPANDDRADAESVMGGYGYARLDLATKEPGEPDHAGSDGGHSVWYRWTPQASGAATIDTCSFSSSLDTLLAVYTVGYGGLQEVESDDDTTGCGSGGTGSRVQFTAVAGTEYLVAVDAKGAADGYVNVGFPPVNDMFGGAVTQTAAAFSYYGDLSRATAQPGEPEHGGSAAARSVWFNWTTPRNGQATIDTCANAGTRVAAYTGASLAALVAVTPRPRSTCPAGQTGSRLRFDAIAGTTYRLAVDVAGSTSSAFYGLSARLGPANDAFAEATNAGSGSTTLFGTSVDAGLQDGEPNHAGSGGAASVWYRWTAPYSASLRVDTCSAASFDTAIALYSQQGTGVAGLQQFAADDDTPGCGAGGKSSRVRVHVESGTTYWVAVTGHVDVEGTFSLQFGLAAANDDFANAGTLPANFAQHGSTVDASDEAGEPEHGGAGDHAVWYRFSISDTRNLELRACPTTGSATPALAVYTGASLPTLLPVGTPATRTIGGVACRVVPLRAASGERRVAVDGVAAAPEGTFTITLAVAQANDDRGQATALSGPGSEQQGTTFAATAEDGEPSHAGVVGGRSVWYRWTPSNGGPVTLDTCGPLDTLLAVYTFAGGVLTPVESSDDATACGTGGSRVTFTSDASTQYFIAVDGKSGAEGSFTLGFPPANDLFAMPTTLSGTLDTRFATTVRGGAEPGEPAHAGSPATRSIWYRWTPTHSSRALLSTCLSSTQATRIALYSGATLATLTTVAAAGPVAGCAGGQGARLRTRVTGGTTYRIAVDADTDGTLTLQAALAPVNDDRADAITVSAGQLVKASNAFATVEDGEPARAGRAADASVWYRFTPTTTGPVTLKTCGSSFATVLGVYDESLGAYHQVAAADDAAGRCASRAALTFTATAGTEYLIAVDDSGGATGSFELAVGSPANDDVEQAAVLTGEHASVTMSTETATKQDGEPVDLFSAGQRSVWWTWTAATSGQIEINTCGSSYYTQLSVYRGAGIGSLTREVSNTFGSGCASKSRLTLGAVAGRTYLIAASAYDGIGGTLRLQLGPPANDRFAGAQPLSGETADVTATIVGATAEDSEPSHGTGARGRSIWYSWTAPDSGLLTLDTCGSPTALFIGAYRGSAVGSLARLTPISSAVVCPDNAPGRRLTVEVDGGISYRFALDGADTGVGETLLHLRLASDSSPPETTIDTAPPLLTNAAVQRFTFSSSETDSTFECRLDTDPFAACVSPFERSPADGEHSFEVRAADRAGNTDPEPARVSFTVDRTAPTVTISSGPDEVINETSASVAFSTPDASATLECQLDSTGYVPCTSPVTRTELSDGLHTWRVRATDPAGNRATATREFTVDTGPPETNLGSVPADPTNAATPSISFSSEAGATFACSIDAGAFEACSSPRLLPGLEDGDHTVRVRATDHAGNPEIEPAAYAFTIDRSAPDTRITGQPSGPAHSGHVFEFDATESATFECAIDAGVFRSCSTGQALDLAGVSAGVHTFRVRASDDASNIDPTPATAPFDFTNAAPQAVLTVSPDAGPANLDVEATISATDSDADALDYKIDFGDGARQSGPLPRGTPIAHTYERAGVFIVRLEVSDTYSSHIATRDVAVVLPEPLKANAGDDFVAVVGESVKLDGSGSRPQAGIGRYDWTFGDGASGTGAVINHVYTAPGTYDATLTTRSGAQIDSDTATVRVLPPSTPSGMRITVQSDGSAVAGADVVIVASDGQRFSAVTDSGGSARLQGLADGRYKVLGYAPQYLPGSVTVTQASGSGEGTINLPAGDVAQAKLTSRRLTISEILALGIDPDDPENQNVVEFEVKLQGKTHKGHASSGGFIGSASGLTCGRYRCHGGGMTINHVELAPGIPGLTTLVLPFRARWLKEFFEVSMTVHNLAPDPQFVLRNGAARLELPDGLRLAPTARGEHLALPMADIPGGGNATATWIVRGDKEGDYLMNANYAATLEPFGRSVSIRAIMEEPLKVWGGSALKVIVETDDEVGADHPFHARVGLRNVAEVPVYNVGLELLSGGDGYIEQPRQTRDFETDEIAPGDTFWSAPLILVPEHSGTIDIASSLVKKVAGNASISAEIVAVDRTPPLEEDPEISSRGREDSLIVEFDAVAQASSYQAFRLIGRDEGFEQNPLPTCPSMPPPPGAPCVSWLEPTKVYVGGLGPNAEAGVAISSVIAGKLTMVHPLIEGRPTTDSPYPRITLEETSPCATYPLRGEYRFEDPDFALEMYTQAFDGDVGGPIDLGSTPSLKVFDTTKTYELDAVPADARLVEVEARNSIGETGPKLRDTLGQCSNYVALGDSYSSGEGVPPFDFGTANDDDHNDEAINNICHRSPKAYSRLLGDQRSDVDSPTFVACSGAVTSDFEKPWTQNAHDGEAADEKRNEDEAAQLDALDDDVDLVSLTAGGNDVGFGYILKRCVIKGFAGIGTCQSEVEPSISSTINNMKIILASLYREIREKAPNARILVLEYPLIFPTAWDRTCEGIRRSDVAWLRRKQEDFNAALADAVEDAGAGIELVSLGSRFDEHDVCQSGGASWFNKVNPPPNNEEHSFHPTEEGQQAMSFAVSHALLNPPERQTFSLTPSSLATASVDVLAAATSLVISTAWPGSDVELSLVSPSGRTIDRSTEATDVEHSVGPTYESYTVADPEPGRWTVRMFGKDVSPNGEPVELAVSQRVPRNNPPEAQYLPSTIAAGVGEPIDFDASASFDLDGTITAYEWTFGDGSQAFGRTPSHAFAATGTYEVTLTVRDDEGASTTQTGAPILVTAIPDTTGPVLAAVPSHIAVAATDAAGAVVIYATPTATDAVSGVRAVSCAPASGSTFVVGTTTVTCSASDAAGNVSQTTFTVTVSPLGGGAGPGGSSGPGGVTKPGTGTRPSGQTQPFPLAFGKVSARSSISVSALRRSGITIRFTSVGVGTRLSLSARFFRPARKGKRKPRSVVVASRQLLAPRAGSLAVKLKVRKKVAKALGSAPKGSKLVVEVTGSGGAVRSVKKKVTVKLSR